MSTRAVRHEHHGAQPPGSERARYPLLGATGDIEVTGDIVETHDNRLARCHLVGMPSSSLPSASRIMNAFSMVFSAGVVGVDGQLASVSLPFAGVYAGDSRECESVGDGFEQPGLIRRCVEDSPLAPFRRDFAL